MLALRLVVVGFVFGALGCSNVLGADFDPENTGTNPKPDSTPKVSIVLAEHPHETPHVGLPLPPASLTGTGKVTWSDGDGSCTSSCTIPAARKPSSSWQSPRKARCSAAGKPIRQPRVTEVSS